MLRFLGVKNWKQVRPTALIIPLTAMIIADASREAHAIPFYARKHNVSCTTCHVNVPKLNAYGMDFFARGYRLPAKIEDATKTEDQPEPERSRFGPVPFSIWLTGRQEEQLSDDFSELFLPKVELISGGPIGDSLSYFVEWRLISLQTRSDGSLRDRSGRFEDAFVNWQVADRHSFTIGQYRALNQVDVSRRVSISEPAVFSTSLAGDPSGNERIESLRSFSPSGRSPGITYGLQSIKGESPSQGLFHFATLPFVGEFSIPLTPEAKDEASFQFQGPPKGVFLETFYRQNLNSIGLHTFIDDDRWLLTGVGTLNLYDFFVTGGLGVDDQDGASSRLRSSLEIEYHLVRDLFDALRISDVVRPGIGFRVENISKDGREPAYIPYFAVSGPNEFYTTSIQIQYRSQKGNDAFFIDMSLIF